MLSMKDDLVDHHKHLLDMLKWDDDQLQKEFVQAVPCSLNPGIPTNSSVGLEAYIYVDDILASAVGKKNILRLLAAIIEAIFIVVGRVDIERRQCPLSIEKWNESVVSPVQTVLGLTVNTNKMIVSITQEYKSQVLDLLATKWPDTRRYFRFTTSKS